MQSKGVKESTRFKDAKKTWSEKGERSPFFSPSTKSIINSHHGLLKPITQSIWAVTTTFMRRLSSVYSIILNLGGTYP